MNAGGARAWRTVRGRVPREKRLTALERWGWPAGLALAAGGWYASESLRHRREGAFGYRLTSEIEVGEPDFVRAAEALTGAPISEGNEAELLINGDEIFPAMLEAIDAAEQTLCVQTYVYWTGEIADEVASRICRRAQTGVECNVLLDALGAAQMDGRLLDKMERAGVHVIRFRPPKPYALRRLTNRSHRRLLVADGKVGMTGGVGIADEWTGDAEDPDHWRDTHIRVRGPVVRGMQGAFNENWLEGTGQVLTGDGYLPELKPVDGGGSMQLVRSSAGVGDTNVEALYFLAIAAASKSLDLTAAYFVPRPAFIEALVEACQRGVTVRIVVPGPHIDKGFVRLAGRGAYDTLLEAGVELYEYQPTMLHAKTLTVDEVWASVGSVNFDNRSFQLHDEVTACVWDKRFVARLTEVFARDLERSRQVDPSRWSDRGLARRASESALTLMRREL